ncbi:hypothetical protein JDW21_19105 [Bacillus subtilis]|uniref:Cytidylate kinase n=1 Tax=Bacillus phage vB_BsuS_PJN02 TaxID=2920374 RepID=A0AC61TS36_9CAUD|nr:MULTISPECIES: hypothetical protein [Bacillus subtilis group]YP_010681782.1 cytidylate kinase [Bacillus phage vB_BsuS_PJN02]UUG68131.1 hypothetical protein [Bacillus phage PK-3]MCR4362087.1 hypothetical protein [Bacillus subtilis]UNH58507.1 cytidylate kinase [Bacillus phage vB_BsuS_PJN02]UQB84301.1 hypothetical protein KMZ31_19455 [Bacillus amyloliquefaciens]WOF32933.1 hypothetical protein OEJ84_22680 [Bacillus subtilis]
MLEIDILEGARGTGKSSLAFRLRQTTPETTLINFTGFHNDGEQGLEKVKKYYSNWMHFLFKMYNHDSKLLFDRFYFSEEVYSALYKEYNFTEEYKRLNELLEDLSEFGVKINIFFLTIKNKDELKERLIRDKVPFGKAEESVSETLNQQHAYSLLFDSLEINYKNENLSVHWIDTTGKTGDEVYAEVLQLKAT